VRILGAGLKRWRSHIFAKIIQTGLMAALLCGVKIPFLDIEHEEDLPLVSFYKAWTVLKDNPILH